MVLWLIGIGKNPWDQFIDKREVDCNKLLTQFESMKLYVQNIVNSHTNISCRFLTIPKRDTQKMEYLFINVVIPTITFNSPADYHNPPRDFISSNRLIFEIYKNIEGKEIKCRGALSFGIDNYDIENKLRDNIIRSAIYNVNQYKIL